MAAPWGSARDGRAAGTLAGPGPKPPQRRVWRTVWLCLGGAASANRSAALAEPPWSPPSCRLEETVALGLAVRSTATSGARRGGGGAYATPPYPLRAGGRRDPLGSCIWVGPQRHFPSPCGCSFQEAAA